MNRTPTVVYFCPNLAPTTEQVNTLIGEYQRLLGIHVKPTREFSELIRLIQDPSETFDFLTLDLEYLQDLHGANMFDLVRTLYTLIQCSSNKDESGQLQRREVKIVGVVGDTTDPGLIRLALSVPEFSTLTLRHSGSPTYDQVVADSRRFLSGDTEIPTVIRDWAKPRRNKTKKESSIHLTPRQTQILDLVSTRGASNKVIARMLSISESTVKLHVSAILKKYGCRNRTQLAVFSRQQKDKQEA